MPRPYTDVSTILRSRNRDLKTTHNTFRVVTCTFTFFATTFLETPVYL